MAVDTFFAGTLKGIGRISLQTVLDCHSRYAWARLYTSKLPLTAVQILNNDVLPFFEKHLVEGHDRAQRQHLRVQGRTKWYEALDEMQKDLDVYLVSYNTKRPHQGRGMKGRTPYQIFKDRLPKKGKKTATLSAGKEVKKAA